MKTSMQHIVIATCLALGSYGANAAVVNFDDVPTGTIITNQYAGAGIVFSSSRTISNGEQSSAPNFIIASSTSFDPITMNFLSPVDQVTMTLISVGAGQVTVTAYAADLTTILASVSVQNLNGPANGLNNHDPISLSSPGIARIFARYTITSPVDGFGIDDVSFHIQSVASVPEPGSTSFVLLAIVLAGVGGAMRKQAAW